MHQTAMTSKYGGITNNGIPTGMACDNSIALIAAATIKGAPLMAQRLNVAVRDPIGDSIRTPNIAFPGVFPITQSIDE